MQKNNIIKLTASFLIGGLPLVVSLVSAQTTPLTASCAGSVSSSTITWTVSASGGVTPYSYLWLSGDGVTGSTSTSVAVTYATNGIRSVVAQVYDFSTSTSTTSSTVSANCSATVTSFSTNATSTPLIRNTQFHAQPKLQIEQNGRFLAHGMIVQSVSTNSFTGLVWGVTYIVKVNTAGVPQFFLEKDKGNGRTFDMSQIQVSDEMGVSGWVSASLPLVVNAQVLRDYSITTLRQNKSEKDNHENSNKEENKNSSSNINEIRGRLDGLLKQLQNLQSIFKSRFGGEERGD
ncbi:MAG TPA: SprB repeat-containing protein [Candidatus Paceibacterota bacterium]